MSKPRDGEKVSYVGDPTKEGLRIGDEGQALSVTEACSHVMWATGARTGQVDLVDNEDLVSRGGGRVAGSVFDDSVSHAGLVTVAVRETYDTDGGVGLLNALNEAGHLASLEAVADEALAFVCAQVRSDPAFSSVLGQLDESEAADFVSLTATSVLRDAFGSD